MATTDNFGWPWQYNFPPFFTLQPNLDTQNKQLEAWCELVLAYHRHQKQFSLDVTEAQNSPLFYNKKIDRKLSQETIQIVLEDLKNKGNVEWTDRTKKQCLVMWRSPSEWGKLIYQWASSHGMLNSVCTLYELANGDDTADQEFHGLETWLLQRALQTLENQRKAELMSFDGNEGVKFF